MDIVYWIGVISSLVTILVFAIPDLRNWFLALLIRGHRFNWDKIPKHIEKAEHRVFILQTWLPALRLEMPWWKKALANQNIEFRVLLLDQKLVPFRLRCREQDSGLLTQNVGDLTKLSQTLNSSGGKSRFEVRFFSSIPFGPIYIIDDDIYWGIYLSNEDSMMGPVFHNKFKSKLGRQIFNSFEAIWHSASFTTGSLGVSTPKPESRRSHQTEETDIKRKISQTVNTLMPPSIDNLQEINVNKGGLCLIRHAETDLNLANIFTGELNVGINDAGRRNARFLGEKISYRQWDKIYSSPLRRCIETLYEAIPNQIETIEIRDELRERAMGDLEGYSRITYSSSLPQYSGMDIFTSFHTVANNGESYCDVFWRVLPFVNEVVSQVKVGKRILVLSHEGPIRMIMMALEGLTGEEAIKKEVVCCKEFYYIPEISTS